jgi:hypothetical protein
VGKHMEDLNISFVHQIMSQLRLGDYTNDKQPAKNARHEKNIKDRGEGR